jgi:hypothetical protein
MDNISRRRFVRMLAGIPLIGIATRSASVMAERTSLQNDRWKQQT